MNILNFIYKMKSNTETETNIQFFIFVLSWFPYKYQYFINIIYRVSLPKSFLITISNSQKQNNISQ